MLRWRGQEGRAYSSCMKLTATERDSGQPGTPAGLEAQIRQDLLDRYGPLLTADALATVLGYPTVAALRQAIVRGRAPVRVFTPPGRRGKFALTHDVASWLARQSGGIPAMAAGASETGGSR